MGKKSLMKKISDAYYMYRAKRGWGYSVIIKRGKPAEIEALLEKANSKIALEAAKYLIQRYQWHCSTEKIKTLVSVLIFESGTEAEKEEVLTSVAPFSLIKRREREDVLYYFKNGYQIGENKEAVAYLLQDHDALHAYLNNKHNSEIPDVVVDKAISLGFWNSLFLEKNEISEKKIKEILNSKNLKLIFACRSKFSSSAIAKILKEFQKSLTENDVYELKKVYISKRKEERFLGKVFDEFNRIR